MKVTGKKSPLRSAGGQESLFVGLCSAALLGYSLYHHRYDRNITEWRTSPYLFPALISLLGLLLAVSLAADALRGGEERGAAEGAPKDRPAPAVFLAASALYRLLLPVLHFLPATALYLMGLFLFLGERRWLRAALLSAAVTAGVFALFGLGLSLRLP